MSFCATLLATLAGAIVGALVGIGGTWWLRCSDSKRQYKRDLDLAVSKLIESVEAYSATKQALSIRQWSAQSSTALPGGEIPGLRSELMAGAELRSSLNAARMLAKGDDGRPLEAIQNLLVRDFGEERGAREQALRDTGAILLSWRRDILTAPVAADQIANLVSETSGGGSLAISTDKPQHDETT